MTAPINTADARRFTGGGTFTWVARILGVLGLAATGAGYFVAPQQAAYSYLVAFAYWTGLAVGSLILLAIFHAVGAKWMMALRRLLETMGTMVVPMAVLFIPIALSLGQVYIWVNPPDSLPEHTLHLLHFKHGYLNPQAFLLRTFFYFAVWVAFSTVMFMLSGRQDQSRGAVLAEKLRIWATGSIPFLGLTLTFAAFDWMMSLEPTWFSTMFGVYYFAGSFLTAIATLTVVAVHVRGSAIDQTWIGKKQFHNLGMMLLGFTAFWAYIGYCQFMLIWDANLPEEVTWYVSRAKNHWMVYAIFMALVHFVLPFLALLSRKLKEKPRLLGFVALWLLVAHLLDVHYIIMPALHPDAPAPHPLDLAAFLGVGGAAISFALWRLKGWYAVPVGDPRLDEALRLAQ